MFTNMDEDVMFKSLERFS